MTRREPPHPIRHVLLRSILAFGLLWLGDVVRAAELDYAAELAGRARALRLADDPYWHLLLHYRPTVTGGVRSEADDPGFFLSSVGQVDPAAELEATLSAFFSTAPVGRSRQPAQCAFVARYEWLRERLAFDERRLPPHACERFQAWLREIDAESITLIFPSSFMNNPSSMFGHILLRFDQRGQTDQTRILAYTVNYAADVPADAGIAFAVKGIAGGYKGYFSTIPYYLKVREYGDLENRDIWEYRLAFTPVQLRRVLAHAWELGNAYFDYYFFKENCAYHILSLLEVGDPTLRLRERFRFWTIPADAIRLLVEHPGLVKEVTYRPSRSTLIRRKREALNPEERPWMHRLAADPSQAHSSAFQTLAPDRRALLLEVTSDYLLYAGTKDAEQRQTYWAKNVEVLAARSSLSAKAPRLTIPPLAASPEQGHRTSRAGAGVGWRNGRRFEEVSLRAAYHDLLDPQRGYLQDAQIEVAEVSLRHYDDPDQVRLERFTLANILSLSPIDDTFRALSWKVQAGMQTVRHDGCRLCSIGVLSGGAGAAVESRLLGRAVYFALAEVESDVGGAYAQDHRVGGGGTAGLVTDLTERWRVLATTTYLRFPLGDRSEDWRAFVGQRYTVSRNLAVRVEFNHRRRDDEFLLLLHAYF